ncbi:MAG: alpha/beta hydrolase, partial [Opitutaceae bacterium]|nr:alpha/beta hydrolase [Verrucomicrobiales bacterium]
FGHEFNDAAVIILPGGGYEGLSSQEGEGYAGVFQLWGFRAFVCNYRLGSEGHRHPDMLHDAARAVRHVRANAVEWGVDPDKIILIGSSAGGHLAATLLTRWDDGRPDHPDPVERVSSRPNLGVLCYPVITMGAGTHSGSRDFLLGKDPSPELVKELSAECHVTPQTPECFVWHTHADGCVPVGNAMLFINALHAAGVAFEFHVYQDGDHGLGMKDGHPWSKACLNWLRRRLPANPAKKSEAHSTRL